MKPVLFLDELYGHLIMAGPSNAFFSSLRNHYYKNRLKKTGNFFSSSGFFILTPDKVSIGENCFFNRNVLIAAIPEGPSEIIIGDNCIFGPNVVITASDHPLDDLTKPMRMNDSIPGRILIESGCWIGANVTITKDVKIGKESVIGAGSVVTHDIPEFSIAAGVIGRASCRERV